MYLAVLCASACGNGGTSGLPKSDLEDPTVCRTCHPQHYDEWAGSMHAYAGEDPVFRAMNRRAQDENAATGTFCVNCHAPLAVAEKLTEDGLNLDDLPASRRGVTCYFCHATESLHSGQTGNNPLVLATDGSLYGAFANPAPETPHKALYSPLLDSGTLASATMCGSCHDIQNMQGAHVERTFQEWQSTVFAVTPGGSGCAQCHMAGRDGPASSVTPMRVRRLHSHAFPGVDLAIAPFPSDAPQNDSQRAAAQALLDQSVQSTLCLNPLTSRFELTIDNLAAGHAFPSGATPDRRLWVEVSAYAGEEVIYTSGGSAALPLEASPDPDLWLMRDCLYDGAGNEVSMFWEAATTVSNAVPGTVPQQVADPCSFSVSHVKKTYPDPATSPPLSQVPDRVTVKMHLQAVGSDVLSQLVEGGYLDPSVPPKIARYDIGAAATVEWIKGSPTACITTGTSQSSAVTAVSHARCTPPPRAPACQTPGT